MKLTMSTASCWVCSALLLCAGASYASAREMHVAKTGDDSADGSHERPYLTLAKASEVAQPGDVITVHAGTYREWVKPARGGESESTRITYRAAPGEQATIKGSERIDSWTREGDGTWKVELPNLLFGDYNPYSLNVSGGWLNYGQWHHRGDVYLNGEAYYEKQTTEEVRKAEQSWCCQVTASLTTIRANFGQADPNEELAEINVRESLFMPEITGLKYITIDGLQFAHAAANWAPPVLELQTGAVGPRMGKHWIIENCTITNARCVGIILGHAPGVDYRDIDAFGDHIVRNNVIRRCGQAGIAGQKGATRSVIAGNLIEDTNYRREFGGWETAAIKFHHSVDTVISGNLIRGVFRQEQGAFGIWIDYGNQGLRITRNVIYNTEAATVFLEMNHGPTLVDHNVLIGQEVRSNSEATVFAHNLFVDCPYEYMPDVERQSEYYEPHTTKLTGHKTGTAQDDKWFNNIFVRRGLESVKAAPGYVSDYNVFLEGAKPSSFGDQHSAVDTHVTGCAVDTQALGATVTFSVNESPLQVPECRVDATLVGVFPTVGQALEDRHGTRITLETDWNGRPWLRPLPGPLATLQRGDNAIAWSLRKSHVGPVRLQDKSLSDDGGPFLGLGVSYFQALRHAKYDRERLKRNLALFASSGFNYVRILSMVSWDGLEIVPVTFTNRSERVVQGWPDYWTQFRDLLDLASQQGLRVEVTIFADAQYVMPARAARQSHLDAVLANIAGREPHILHLEVANEAWQNGFPGAQGVEDLREFAQYLGDRTSVPVAITSNADTSDEGIIALYRGSAADLATVHFSRDTRTVEGGWLPVRDAYRAGNLPGVPPVSSNEPIGPGSSVSSESDPIKLCAAAVFAYLSNLPAYVYHSRAGVYGYVRCCPPSGGEERFEDSAGIHAYQFLRDILPPDLASWVRNDGLDPNAPLTVYCNNEPNRYWPDVSDPTDGCVRNIGSIKENEFVCFPMGIQGGGVTLEARRPLRILVFHPLTGAMVTHMTLQVGERFTLPQGPGAYICKGTLLPGG